MRRYLRNRDGRTFFFTLVTHERHPILTTPLGRQSLRSAIRQVRQNHHFEIVGIVILPDHLHTVWELPPGDSDYSMRWRLIKSSFTRNWLAHGANEGLRTQSRRTKGEHAIWQRRFYEHTCRGEDDLIRCMDYLHVNPLKHGLVEKVRDWPWSSFHRYVAMGHYTQDWGSSNYWHGDEFIHFE